MIITILICMISNVYFTKKFDMDSITKIYEKVLSEEKIEKNQRVAIKVHFGEKGNTGFVKPKFIKPVVDLLKNIY